MKKYPTSNIRNIGLLSHGGAGKTSLVEAMVYSTGSINRLGRVEDGNTVSDWDPDEARRGMSISTSIIPIEWNDHKVNILDTPGYVDFAGDVIATTSIIDSAVILIDASSGVEVGTEFSWRYAEARSLPRLLVINKIDRENANFTASLESAQAAFGTHVVPQYIPIGQESNFRGLIDLLKMKALIFGDDIDGAFEEIAIPEDMLDEAETYRLQLVEAIAENDEDLMLKYLEDEELTYEELGRGLQSGVRTNTIVPVLTLAATTNRGVQLLLDALVDLAPPPGPTLVSNGATEPVELLGAADEPAAAFVWKTIADPYVGKLSYFKVIAGVVRSDSHLQNAIKDEDERLGQVFIVNGKDHINVDELGPGDIGAIAKLTHTETNDTLCDANRRVTVEPIEFPAPLFAAAVAPQTKADLDKMGQALARLAEEDPTIRISRDADSSETIVSGLGESHIQIALDRVARKFGVHVEFSLPTIQYRETIQSPVQSVEYKHKKQTGGHGQYGHVLIDMFPSEEPFEFEQSIFGGSVPRQYIPAVEKGVAEAMEHGVLTGFPVINVRVVLTDGSYHSVDSSEMAFKLAAFQAFRKGQQAANPALLEPLNSLAVTIPDSYTGDVMSDLTAKRAHVTGMVPGESGYSTIEATVPAAEIQRYATDLRSITQGRGTFVTEFVRYEQVPPHLIDGIIMDQKAKEEALV